MARYLLPLATNTSLGQIVNARTLETQVSRLLSHPMRRCASWDSKLRDAATGPAWNVKRASRRERWWRDIAELDPALGEQAEQRLLSARCGRAPTLVKYAAAERVS